MKYCTFHEFREIVDLKLGHKRFGQKREVFEVLGRVLLGVVVTKLSLEKKADNNSDMGSWRELISE